MDYIIIRLTALVHLSFIFARRPGRKVRTTTCGWRACTSHRSHLTGRITRVDRPPSRQAGSAVTCKRTVLSRQEERRPCCLYFIKGTYSARKISPISAVRLDGVKKGWENNNRNRRTTKRRAAPPPATSTTSFSPPPPSATGTTIYNRVTTCLLLGAGPVLSCLVSCTVHCFTVHCACPRCRRRTPPGHRVVVLLTTPATCSTPCSTRRRITPRKRPGRMRSTTKSSRLVV